MTLPISPKAVTLDQMPDYSADLRIAKKVQWGCRAVMAVLFPASFYNMYHDPALKTWTPALDPTSLWTNCKNNLNVINIALAAAISIDAGLRPYIRKLEAYQSIRETLMNPTKIEEVNRTKAEEVNTTEVEEANKAIIKLARDIKG